MQRIISILCDQQVFWIGKNHIIETRVPGVSQNEERQKTVVAVRAILLLIDPEDGPLGAARRQFGNPSRRRLGVARGAEKECMKIRAGQPGHILRSFERRCAGVSRRLRRVIRQGGVRRNFPDRRPFKRPAREPWACSFLRCGDNVRVWVVGVKGQRRSINMNLHGATPYRRISFVQEETPPIDRRYEWRVSHRRDIES